MQNVLKKRGGRTNSRWSIGVDIDWEQLVAEWSFFIMETFALTGYNEKLPASNLRSLAASRLRGILLFQEEGEFQVNVHDILKSTAGFSRGK